MVSSVQVEPLDSEGLRWAQALVVKGHYLHKRVDVRCSPLAYGIVVDPGGIPRVAGCLIFGRPEATRKYGFYGSLTDLAAGSVEVSRWCVLNLARVYIQPEYQRGGALFDLGPGYTDRQGEWRSTLASTAVNAALERMPIDYLLSRPPCFPDEPYQLRYCLSYCDTNRHKGTLYRAAGFSLYCQNERGIQTWRKRLRDLTPEEDSQVLAASASSTRSRRYRAERAIRQLDFLEVVA